MQTDPSAEARNGWLWFVSSLALLAGMALGWRTMRSQNSPLPTVTSLSFGEPGTLKFNHPFPGGPVQAGRAGDLRISLYSGRELAGAPVATVVKPPVFYNGTQWLGELVAEKLARSSDNFSMKMRGWITLTSSRTNLHLRSDNGFRIRLRNALGQEQKLEHWVDDVTDDSAFAVVAEPGRYEIEIDYFNGVGDYFFQMSAAPQAKLEPEMDGSPMAR